MGHLSGLLFSDWVVSQLTFSTPYWQSPLTPTGSITPQFHFVLLYSFKVTAFTHTSGSMSCVVWIATLWSTQDRKGQHDGYMCTPNSPLHLCWWTLMCSDVAPGVPVLVTAHTHICTYAHMHTLKLTQKRTALTQGYAEAPSLCKSIIFLSLGLLALTYLVPSLKA